MASKTELERLAQAAHAMRPDWPARSVLTYLEREHSARAYRDLAVALAFVAADPKTATPRRMSEPGPWWKTTTDAPEDLRAGRCPVVGHGSYVAHNCGACRSERIGRDMPATPEQRAEEFAARVSRERIRAILAAADLGATDGQRL